MDCLKKNRSHLDNCSLFENLNRSDLDKSFVTVHADTFSEREFDKLLDCLDSIRVSEKKKRRSARKNRRSSFKNYCVRVPDINNSQRHDDEPNADVSYDEFDKTCDDLRSNISQMFSYFEEDVNLDFDEKSPEKRRISDPSTPQDFREKFLRNRSRIDESFKAADTRPVIRGVIKKASPPRTTKSSSSLAKNQVDKIMNEFNRVKINYYSKENYVEFTEIDYAYCDSMSDMESLRSENFVGKLDQGVVSKFESSENVDETGTVSAVKSVGGSVKRKPSISFPPKNSVRDKIAMFSKMNFGLTKVSGSDAMGKKMQHFESKRSPKRPTMAKSTNSLFKNSSQAHKNLNKCHIKDINNSILQRRAQVAVVKPITKICVDESSSTTLDIIEKVQTLAPLNDAGLLVQLESVITKFNMSLLHTIESLIMDDVYASTRPQRFHIETRPSIDKFNRAFAYAFDFAVEGAGLSELDDGGVQLQIRVNLGDDSVTVNVIFMAQYDPAVPDSSVDSDDDMTFCVYFISVFEPPENELQKARDNDLTLSEHQLRVQASLQKLNIPDWYKQYSNTSSACATPVYSRDGPGLLRKRNSESGRWQGLNSKTTSLSSLGSNRSDRSPVMLSPSAHSHTGAGQTTGFSRWSTSHLNSSQTSPSVSARSSFVRNTNYTSSIISGNSVASSSIQPTSSDVRNSFRKPYLGWRSQEKLSQPKTPHERLAQSLLQQKQAQQKLQQPVATPEIQSSIKEVTSAIVHYVNDQTNRGGSRSRSVSPSPRCWLESSFVGSKPVDSPQTPALINDKSSFVQTQKVNIGPMSVTATNYDSYRINGRGESTMI